MKTILIDGPGLWRSLNKEDRNLEIQLKGSELERAENIELIGLVLDQQLSFDIYFDSLCKTMTKRLGIFNRIIYKAYLPTAERVLYYNALIKPLINSWSSAIVV